MDPLKLKEEFFSIYGDRDIVPALFFSPGRVNLIGEHTDYNNGYVFPCALNFGTYLAVRQTSGDTYRFASLNFDDRYEVRAADFGRIDGSAWSNYPLGVIREFKNRGIETGGIEFLYWGDIPNGAGLSSSASIEMVTAVALNMITGSSLEMIDLVRMCQSAENNFVGMNCGIMDQFAVGFGRANMALFLNCDTLEYENVPFQLKDCSLVITNTNKRRGLTDSKYNERRGECERAVSLLSPRLGIAHLSQLNPDQFEDNRYLIGDETIERRAKHVVYENSRVLEAVKVLRQGDIIRFGQLMNESHDSLREDYEVTGIELDTLVYESRKISGVIGSRMTGAGFGGCTVSIVEDKSVESFISILSERYHSLTGLKAGFYLPTIGGGARMV